MATAAATKLIPPSLLLNPPPSKIEAFTLSNSLTLLLSSTSSRNFRRITQKRPQLWRISAATDNTLPSEASIEKIQKIVPDSADSSSVSTIVSALLFAAFIGLSLLTVGVIYLAIQDFLQKREKEKFEKEEAEKKKKGGKKKKARARTGPRGFGQKIDEDEGDDD